jgi:hypothetical protein
VPIKKSTSRRFLSKPGPQHTEPENLFLHARSFHIAAKRLAAAFSPEPEPFGDSAAFPVLFMYRHAIELHLKAFVLGEGGNFIAVKPDELSLYKTHSLPWLAQFVCGIITAVGWEHEFKCEGVESFADFKAVVETVNSVDPGSYTFYCPVDSRSVDSIRDFGRRMDGLIELLAATADGLAAEWDLRADGVDVDGHNGGFEPTIQ